MENEYDGLMPREELLEEMAKLTARLRPRTALPGGAMARHLATHGHVISKGCCQDPAYTPGGD